MKLTIRPRQAGKTTELIKHAAKNGLTIVCMDDREKERVQDQADRLLLVINPPMTFHDFINRNYSQRTEGLAIDNADLLLKKLAIAPILAVTMSDDEQPL